MALWCGIIFASTLLTAASAGCGEGEGSQRAVNTHVDTGDTLRGQGVEIIDGRFVPDLVAVDPAQPVNFINRDDVAHRIVKVSAPGRDFRTAVLEPGERD